MQSFLRRPKLPIIPSDVLIRYQVQEPKDTRFASSARLLQSIWREARQYGCGEFVDAAGEIRSLGSLLSEEAARAGANFLSPEIASFVRRDTAYREVGAFIDERRLWTNLLSSHPLTYNLFAPLASDMKLASEVFRLLLPDFVSEVLDMAFEHSPGRGNNNFTGDHTAFDLIVVVRTVRNLLAFVSIEMKYSESMFSALRSTSPRLNELSAASGLFHNHTAPALRTAPVQQFWREHLLSWAIVNHMPDVASGRFVVIHPMLNEDVGGAVASYLEHVVPSDDPPVGFQRVYLEECLQALSAAGGSEMAAKLAERYTDFSAIERLIADWCPTPSKLPAST